MNLRELPSPLRIYWDLPAAPSDPALCLKICEEIIGMKILYLSLRDTASTVSPLCLEILDRLKGEHIALSLSVSASAPAPSLLSRLSAQVQLLIESTSLDGVRDFLKRKAQYVAAGLMPGIAFDIRKDNYRDIPEVVSSCANNGAPDLVFPIQRLAGGRGPFYISGKEREELAQNLRKVDHRKTRITIHDPFLWEAFYPDTDYHEGGCQAANSMLFISPEYGVCPCPAMPFELGRLHETTLAEIIVSVKKKELRRSLLDPPAECAACDRARKCLGGCRGRAFAAGGSLDLRDPACK